MNPRKEAANAIEVAIKRAQAAQQISGRNPLDELPKAKPKPLSPEGERLKAELDQLVASQLALTPAERSTQHFDRLMTARQQPLLTPPPTHPHPFLDATIEAVERVRTTRLSGTPINDEQLCIDFIFAGNTNAFDAFASLRRWDIEQRISLLEQAETVLAKELSGKT